MRALASIAAALALAAAVAPAGAATSAGGDLRDARYCELLVLDRFPPDARVVVWNTIGFNDCPSGWWGGFEAGPLAAELGAAYVVLNGPRHFLMDSARARTGEVRRFHGRRMRKVATIPIAQFADLAQTPYAERTISRTNTWHWNAGRRVFELLAPDGANYVMQSYSQIVDPRLELADLPRLGERLALPEGWSYRVRRLKRPLTLAAEGSATILQDDLKNTYQRVPDRADDSRRHRVDVSGTFKAVGSPEPGTIEDRGSVDGSPFGPAALRLLDRFASDGTVTGEIRMETARGLVLGTFAGTYEFAGSEVDIDATVQLTGGTGRYRGIRGRNLDARVRDTIDGQNGTLSLTGFARY